MGSSLNGSHAFSTEPARFPHAPALPASFLGRRDFDTAASFGSNESTVKSCHLRISCKSIIASHPDSNVHHECFMTHLWCWLRISTRQPDLLARSLQPAAGLIPSTCLPRSASSGVRYKSSSEKSSSSGPWKKLGDLAASVKFQALLLRLGYNGGMARRRSRPRFYAVSHGHKTGIFKSWAEAQEAVEGFQSNRHKSFADFDEAKAWLEENQAVLPNLHIKRVRPGNVGSCEVDPEENLRQQQKRDDEAALNFLAAWPPSLSQSPSPPSAPRPSKRVRREPPQSQQIITATAASSSTSLPKTINVYCDGASSSNGRFDAAAGWGVWFSDSGPLSHLNSSGRLDGPLQTNNRAELTAIIKAIELCPGALPPRSSPSPSPSPSTSTQTETETEKVDPVQLVIHTDSLYSIQCLTTWSNAWRRNQWVSPSSSKPVLNRDLIRCALHLIDRCTYPPLLRHVRGHRGNHGNERADRLAVAGANMERVPMVQWRKWEPPPSDDEK